MVRPDSLSSLGRKPVLQSDLALGLLLLVIMSYGCSDKIAPGESKDFTGFSSGATSICLATSDDTYINLKEDDAKVQHLLQDAYLVVVPNKCAIEVVNSKIVGSFGYVHFSKWLVGEYDAPGIEIQAEFTIKVGKDCPPGAYHVDLILPRLTEFSDTNMVMPMITNSSLSLRLLEKFDNVYCIELRSFEVKNKGE